MSTAPERPSRYLPKAFDARRPIAVVAGQRAYPGLMVAGLRRAGLTTRLIALEGETDDALYDSFSREARARVKVGQVGHLLKALRRLDAGYVLFVGQVTPGKLFKDLVPDLKALALLARLKERNAETVFGAIAAEIEALGIEMLDARAFMDDHLALPGLMTAGRQRAEETYVEHGIRIAREMARLDVGQGVVVRKGTVLAVEAFEGTDAMLARANHYKTDRLIFVKTAKARQNPYFDWPVFGAATLAAMRGSGITTAALEAGRVLMLHRDALIAQAQDEGIELLGF